MTHDRRPLALFDLDGTLADTAHRQRFLEQKPKNWAAFFAAAVQDAPLGEGVAALRSYEMECEIQYLTGRPERCRADTEEWLERHGLPGGRVWMRRNDDRRPARFTKIAVLRRIARDREVRVLVDDDPLVCQEVERAGFRVLRADWAVVQPMLRDAQEREGRT